MQRARLRQNLLVFCLMVSTGSVLADGKVFPEVFYPKVEIPNQQALVHFSDGLERLVIETSFLGEGTNFAWVVPLPSAPEVKPVSENFFSGLQQAFRPELIHRVHHYYAGMLFVCGLAFLGWRSLRAEVSWVVDLPLCLVLAASAGLLGKDVLPGLLALTLTLCTRLFTRSPAVFGVFLLVGTSFAAILTVVQYSPPGFGLIQTLGGAESEAATIPGVTIVSVQHAGVFETTTIRGANPSAVREWLERNGYQVPKSAEPAIRYYVEQGWVFVASQARCSPANSQLVALHPLAFTFAARAPVYPTRLTAVDNGSCAIDLYVFGSRRAAARHFSAVRCERLTTNLPVQKHYPAPGLRISDPEVLALIGNSSVGTKLFGRLSPAQMASDVKITSRWFLRKGATVYSHSGALVIALNVALPLAALSWLLIGSSRGGWNVNEEWIVCWRWRLLAAAMGLGRAVFFGLPKVEVQTVPSGSSRDLAQRN